jgi:hypothetical protein
LKLFCSLVLDNFQNNNSMKNLFILVILFLISSCAVFKGKKMTQTELYFGLSKNDGSLILSKDWQAFADTVIAKTFSDGSTLLDAHGQWLSDEGKLISEPSKVLVIISKLDPAYSKQIDLVREKYKKYFQQKSVLRVDKRVRAEF